MPDDERLTTPDDPEGAQFISREAMIQHRVANLDLREVVWSWVTWSPTNDDHNHCVICHDVAFSATYDGDLREGWRSEEATGEPPAWLCPGCFGRFREHFDWRIAT